MNKIIPLFFLLLIIGIRVAFYIVEAPTREAIREAQNIPTASISLPAERTLNEFVKLESGMNFSQVVDVFRVDIPEHKAEMESMVNGPECLVMFKNPGGSSYNLVFRKGRLSTKVLLPAEEVERLERR